MFESETCGGCVWLNLRQRASPEVGPGDSCRLVKRLRCPEQQQQQDFLAIGGVSFHSKAACAQSRSSPASTDDDVQQNSSPMAWRSSPQHRRRMALSVGAAAWKKPRAVLRCHSACPVGREAADAWSELMLGQFWLDGPCRGRPAAFSAWFRRPDVSLPARSSSQ